MNDRITHIWKEDDYTLEETCEKHIFNYLIVKGDTTTQRSYALSKEERVIVTSCYDNPLIRFAAILAIRHHKNQIDKGGHPYIEHLLAVAARTDRIQSCVVGLLHDIVEDTEVTYDSLYDLIPSWALFAIEAITRRRLPDLKKENYDDYLSRVLGNDIATEVKICDMINNLNYSRISNGLPSREDANRIGCYAKYLPILVKKYWDNKDDERDLGPVHTGEA